MTARPRYSYHHLDRLPDAQLYALFRHVRMLLLDRPHDHNDIEVDLISRDETQLLALYRALPQELHCKGLIMAGHVLTTLSSCVTNGETEAR